MTGTVTSEVHICNMSLTRLGHPTITSLDQDTKGAALCKLHYPVVRDVVMRAHPWNFAIRRAALASDALASIAFEYSNRFPLPVDCLKVLRTSEDTYNGCTQSYRIESNGTSRAILTNATTLSIEYIARITDVSQFDALFVDAVSARLTAEIAMALTDNATMAANAMQSYDAKLREARQIDAQEGTPREIIDASGWIMARY